MRTGYTVADVMTHRPVTAEPKDSLTKVAQLMREFAVGSILISEGGKLLGIITEFDLVRRGIANKVPMDTPAKEFMTLASDMVTTTPDVDVFEALNLMRVEEVRNLPVLDGKTLAGYVTLKDILKIQPQLFELIAEKYEIREAERKPARKAERSDEDDEE